VAKLDALYVEVDYREKGIANKLVNKFKELAKKNDCKYVEVSVLNDNVDGVKLYLKNDFKDKTTLYRCEL
jgi:ribosomal protein S18 acetylase RimI-like enzyme